MPKVGMEPIRRKTLIEAAIAAIHDKGSLDVTISQIARHAVVSQGLAHHYFGSKEALLLATMRHLLSEYGAAVRHALGQASGPRSRVSAIIAASLAPEQFRPETVSAWLVFYVHAQGSDPARRLLSAYHGRLRSNLIDALRPIAGAKAAAIAEGVSALIDGFYIRAALGAVPDVAGSAQAMVEAYVDCMTAGQ